MSQHVVEGTSVMAYQVVIRPHTDIRNPAPEFVAALAGQFGHARLFAQGKLCVSVPGAVEGDDTAAAVATVLHAAAAHAETSTGGAVALEVTDARYSGDGYCHVFVTCVMTS